MEFPKILVCAPQHQSKDYCFDEWADRVNSLTYPNYDVLLADNSPTKDYISKIESQGFMSAYITPDSRSVYHTMAKAHNACREYAIKNDYDYILHLETDVFPPLDVIERLVHHKKLIIGATYDILHGDERKLMIQTDEGNHKFVQYRQLEYLEESECEFMDGTVKQVFHAGLGCILISTEVLKNIEFYYVEGTTLHPDTAFAMTCLQRNAPIYVDTDIYCEHKNGVWIENSIL